MRARFRSRDINCEFHHRGIDSNSTLALPKLAYLLNCLTRAVNFSNRLTRQSLSIMSDGDILVEEAKLLARDESEGEVDDRNVEAPRSHVVAQDRAPMTRGDFEMMTKQNLQILKELSRLKRKRSHSQSKSRKRCKKRDQSDTDKSQHSQHSDTEDEQPADLLKSLIRKTKIKPACTDTRPFASTARSTADEDDTDCDSVSQPRLEASAAQKLDKMQKELEKNAEEGPDIQENFVKILHGIYENINLRKDDTKDKSDKIRRPANFQVRVPRVNVEAWQSIDYHTKENDLMLQKRQTLLLKSAYNMAVMCDTCIKSSHEPMIDMMEQLVESIQLNMKAVHEISLERRRKILNSPGVNKKYKNPPFDLPVTDMLFGPDMKSFMTQCDNTSKLGNSSYYPESRSNGRGNPNRKFTKNGSHFGQNEWTQRGRGGHWTKNNHRGATRGGRPSRPNRGRY